MSRYSELTDRLRVLESDIRTIDNLKADTMYEVEPPRKIRDLTISLVSSDRYRKSSARLYDLETVSNQQIHEILEEVLDELRKAMVYEHEDITQYIQDIEQALMDDATRRRQRKTSDFLGDF